MPWDEKYSAWCHTGCQVRMTMTRANTCPTAKGFPKYITLMVLRNSDELSEVSNALKATGRFFKVTYSSSHSRICHKISCYEY